MSRLQQFGSIDAGAGAFAKAKQVKITDHYRATAQWLHDWADDYETGLAQHHTAGMDDSKEMAVRLRHKARNIEATINAYERLKL